MGEIVVAITGASGAIYGKRLLEVLKSHGRDTRLVVSNAGEITLQHECGITKETLAEITNSVLDDEKNIGGKAASGSAKIETDSGETIVANPIAVSSSGEKSRISLRPERVSIDPNEQLENKFTSEIREIIYHGDHTRVRVNLLGNDDFILKVPNASSDLNLNVGDKLDLGWSSHDCRALDY